MVTAEEERGVCGLLHPRVVLGRQLGRRRRGGGAGDGYPGSLQSGGNGGQRRRRPWAQDRRGAQSGRRPAVAGLAVAAVLARGGRRRALRRAVGRGTQAPERVRCGVVRGAPAARSRAGVDGCRPFWIQGRAGQLSSGGLFSCCFLSFREEAREREEDVQGWGKKT